MHSTLKAMTDTSNDQGTDEFEAHSAGTSQCCKCGLSVQLQLLPPVIDPEMVAALEDARTKPHAHHLAQATRELVGTLSTMFRVVRNACQGNRSPIKITSEKPRQLLKFDPPCNHILEILGFELVDDTEFRPPEIGDVSTSGLSLMSRRLERARDELCVLTGRVQRKLREVERKEVFVYKPVTSNLASLLGASDYPKRPGASLLLMASSSSRSSTSARGNTESDGSSKKPTVDSAYRQLGVPEDAADSLVIWSYCRLAEEDESSDPLTGTLAQQRFDSLMAIAAIRTSEELDLLVASERERGMASTTQIRSACKALFGDSGYEVATIDDDTMREMARTQIAGASSTKTRIEMAEHLRVLALAKHSEPLVNYAATLVSELEARESSSAEPTAEALGHMKLQLDTWEQLPVGLNNIGNTCYLNSILQFIYSVTPIREAVMRYGDAQAWNEKLVLGRRDSGKLLTVDEIKRALRFVELLKGLFSTLINHRIESWSLTEARKSSSSAAPGHPLLAASVPSATSLAVTPDRELSNMLLLRVTGDDTTGAPISISSSGTLNMQAEDDNDSKALDATAQTQKKAVPQYHQQQDVDECMTQCVTFLVHALSPEPTLHLETSASSSNTSELVASSGSHDDGSWIHRLLAGHQELLSEKLVNGQRKNTEKPTTEQFVNLNLNIPREAADINDCIDAFFAPSVVPGSSDELPKSSQMMDVDAPEQQQIEFTRHTRIKDAPPVLCMQIQRVQFDVATMRSYKLNSHVRLRRHISLAPYMQFSSQAHAEGGADSKKHRRHQIKDRLAAIDRHLRALETPVRATSGADAMASMSVVSALERVQAFMSGVSSWTEMEAARELLSDLGKPAGTIAQEAHQLSSDLGSMAQALGSASEKWRDERKTLCAELDAIYDNVVADDESAYTLHAVFIHSGLSPEFGHYWVYIRDYDKAKDQIRWLCFNDSNVSVVDENTVFNDSPLPGQETANPYYLVYVRSKDLEGTVNFGV
ncbi:ubiquitin-specific protease ubp2 [Coemansia sp. RSA 487]|nr:ubiquitin-specific protease ubp2 [Coemansia sp. RSA 487]